jgi:hypothetical protein
MGRHQSRPPDDLARSHVLNRNLLAA